MRGLIRVATAIAAFYPLSSAQTQELPPDWLSKAQSQTLTPEVKPKADPSNRLDGNTAAIAWGKDLFFDTGLSRDGAVSCAACHVTDGRFVPNESRPAGSSRKFRSVMPVLGAAFQEFYFWDGRKDSLWSQALGPLENPDEHGLTRTEVVAYLAENDPDRLSQFAGRVVRQDLVSLPPASPLGNREERAAWKALPEPVKIEVNSLFATAGKAIAAFEASLPPPVSDWDAIVAAAAVDPDAVPPAIARGYALFSGKARCATCHSGPLFTDGDFHNTAMPQRAAQPIDMGRQAALSELLSDPFNCLGSFSDAAADDCKKLKYISLSMERALGTFRTPSLRGVSDRAVFGHAGQFTELDQILNHYNTAPLGQHGKMVGLDTLSELIPLGLSPQDLADLKAFLLTL